VLCRFSAEQNPGRNSRYLRCWLSVAVGEPESQSQLSREEAAERERYWINRSLVQAGSQIAGSTTSPVESATTQHGAMALRLFTKTAEVVLGTFASPLRNA